MTNVLELNNKLEGLRKVLEEEKKITSLDKVTKPTLVDEVLSFDYSYLDTLSVKKIVSYLGALSQYLIFLNKHINQISVALTCAEEEFKTAVNLSILAIDHKKFPTVEERKTEAQKDEVIVELKKHVDALNARIAVHTNMPESINNLIQTIKKVYDARIKESFAPPAE